MEVVKKELVPNEDDKVTTLADRDSSRELNISKETSLLQNSFYLSSDLSITKTQDLSKELPIKSELDK